MSCLVKSICGFCVTRTPSLQFKYAASVNSVNYSRHRRPKIYEDPWNPYLGKGGKYSRNFIVPIHDRNLQRSLEPEIRARPVKAVDTNTSPSFTYDTLLQKLINTLMTAGRKVAAREVVHGMLREIKATQVKKYWAASPTERSSIEVDPYKIFNQAIANGKPLIGTYQQWRLGSYEPVPVPLKEKRRIFLVMKWLKETVANNRRTNVPFNHRLAAEVLLMANKEGETIGKRTELHKLCESHKGNIQMRNIARL